MLRKFVDSSCHCLTVCCCLFLFARTCQDSQTCVHVCAHKLLGHAAVVLVALLCSTAAATGSPRDSWATFRDLLSIQQRTMPQQIPASDAARPADGDRVQIVEVRGRPVRPGAAWLACGARVHGLVTFGIPQKVTSLQDFQNQESQHCVPATCLPYRDTWLWPITSVRCLPMVVLRDARPGPTTWDTFTAPCACAGEAEGPIRCGAKHISKSKCTKHTRVGALLEVGMSKKVHAVVARSAFPSQKVHSTPASGHFWKL
jgi:hypothetical protein